MKELKLGECEVVAGGNGNLEAPPSPYMPDNSAGYANMGNQQTQAQLASLAKKIGAGQVH